MTRPHACRRILGLSSAVCFKPAGIPLSALETVTLRLDEREAVRLADLEGMYHEQAAASMGVSRQTFGNIVESARRKIADALVNGRALVIEGGNVAVAEDVPCGGRAMGGDPGGHPRPGCGGRRRRCGRGGHGDGEME